MTIAPDFCQDPLFTCESCLAGMQNPLIQFKENKSWGKFIQPLLLSLTTALIPFLTKKISAVENRKDQADEMR